MLFENGFLTMNMIEFKVEKAQAFLQENNIASSEITKIAGDASFRSYYRVLSGEKKYILMFAPPGFEDVEPFIKIDHFLVEKGFSAPKIIALDESLGFLLLEDLGDGTYSKVLASDVSQELELYKKATDCLIELHAIKESPKNMLTYNHDLLLREVMLFVDWFVPFKKSTMSLDEIAAFKRSWMMLFDNLGQFAAAIDKNKNNEEPVLVLRDYHADNLMFLPDRKGTNQVGLLDFQDAVIGSRAYDLVSLLEDARRDVSPENRIKVMEYYLENANCDVEAFKNDYEILSLQRNIKIVGIFSRLSVRDGKDHYLDFLPRVLNFITLRLESKNPVLSPILSDIAKLIKKFI